MIVFSDRHCDFTQQAEAQQQRHNQLAIWRLIAFFASILAVWLLIKLALFGWAMAAALVGLTGFVQLMARHRAVGRQRDLNRHRATLNHDETQRLARQFTRSETGTSFAPPNHPYAQDLDVFGRHSLYRLLNRTHTRDGAARLAQYLLQPAPPHVVFLRQQAAQALKPHLNWRQDLEATAMLNEQITQSTAGLRDWATGTTPLPAWLGPVRWVLPLLTLGIGAAWFTGNVPGLAVVAALAVHGLVLRQLMAVTKQVSEQTYEIARSLANFADLFRLTEQMPGEAILLTDLRKQLTTGSVMASEAVRQLAKLAENFNFRRNPYFYLLVGLPTLWDAHYLLALNRWRSHHGPALAGWFAALAETESLNSLAGFAYAHPTYAQPDLLEETAVVLDAHDITHPLLADEKAVANSLTTNDSGQTILITGSNMSGKSTFLRTVGLNVVLAQAGAVVAARQFSCSPVQVYTSMRTQDSLEENTSSFYAELKRLRTLLELSSGTLPPVPGLPAALPVLYFLDEILKGTNSADRHKGAEALIRQLHRTTATGFVSTHDLELGQLGDSVNFVKNYHFRSDLEAGLVTFDYRLRPGICQSFNATQLMRAIGIDV